MVTRGMVGTAPAKIASAVVAGIIAAVGSGAVARPPPIAPAALPSRRQQVNQRRPADRNSEGCQRVAHGFPPFRGRLLRRKRPRNSPYWSLNMATSFIDHSSEMWNFPCDSPLYPLSCSIRKVMP
jgi:hypothetical protein